MSAPGRKSETPAPRRPRIFVGPGLLALVVAGAGCATVTPLQTASPVAEGAWQLSGQVSVSPWCGFGLNPAQLGQTCATLPSGLPIPEVRLSARRGFTPRVDAGLSASVQTVLGSGFGGPGVGSFQAQGLVDGKVLLWAWPAEEGRVHLVSAAGGLGFSSRQVGLDDPGRRGALNEVLLALPVYYGYQTPKLEWVVSPRLVQRFGLDGIHTTWLGVQGGFYTRGEFRLGVGLDYLAPTAFLGQGLFTVTTGVLWDLGS